MLYTLENINLEQQGLSIIERRRKTGSNKKSTYVLTNQLSFKLSDSFTITIPIGFEWDLSSVPRSLWSLLPPDGDFEVASLIHDYLYINHVKLGISRSFADSEMLIWSKAVSGTRSKISLRNFDNQIRYIGVRLFGWIVWNKKRK